jgi:hypothetical protein
VLSSSSGGARIARGLREPRAAVLIAVRPGRRAARDILYEAASLHASWRRCWLRRAPGKAVRGVDVGFEDVEQRRSAEGCLQSANVAGSIMATLSAGSASGAKTPLCRSMIAVSAR